MVQADASDGSGKSQTISHDSHNNKLSDNTFDIQRESRVLLKLEISNMNKPVPVLKSKVGSQSQEKSHRGVSSRDQLKIILLMSASRADKDLTGGTQQNSEMYMSPKMATRNSMSLCYIIVLPCCTKFHEPNVVLEYAHFETNIIAMKALPSNTPIFNI